MERHCDCCSELFDENHLIKTYSLSEDEFYCCPGCSEPDEIEEQETDIEDGEDYKEAGWAEWRAILRGER